MHTSMCAFRPPQNHCPPTIHQCDAPQPSLHHSFLTLSHSTHPLTLVYPPSTYPRTPPPRIYTPPHHTPIHLSPIHPCTTEHPSLTHLQAGPPYTHHTPAPLHHISSTHPAGCHFTIPHPIRPGPYGEHLAPLVTPGWEALPTILGEWPGQSSLQHP